MGGEGIKKKNANGETEETEVSVRIFTILVGKGIGREA